MRTRFTVLGSGAFAPEAGEVRNPAGYALETGGEIVLFDLGFGNLRQLFRAGLDASRVSHVFLSHQHPDHVGDLPALLFHFRYEGKPLGKKLTIAGPKGFSRFLSGLIKAHSPWLGPRGYRLRVIELEEGASVDGKDWRVSCHEVPHKIPALAYRFESKSASVCYSGDTGYNGGLAQFARDADLFVLECTLPDRERFAWHLRVSEALELFDASRAKRGLMTHLSRTSARELSRRLRGKPIRAAQDLLTFEITRC